VDEETGEWSAELGPTPQQEAFAHCAVNGQVGQSIGPQPSRGRSAKARRRESPPP
jgi:hypothetical protein